MSGYFVTGTDTDVGKTLVSSALLHQMNQQQRWVGFKPVACGVISTPEGPKHEDVVLLQHHSAQPVSYELVGPQISDVAIAPHIAAAQEGKSLDIANTMRHFEQLKTATKADGVIVEGAGGWLVPLNEQESMADLAVAVGFPVILVVAMRLGCLNHALLSQHAILSSGLPFAGWVATSPTAEVMPVLEENLSTLKHHLSAPFLGYVPYLGVARPEAAAEHIKLG